MSTRPRARLGLSLAGACCALYAATPAAADAARGVLRVTASALHTRSGPSSSSPSLGLITKDHSYPELERRGAWVRLQVGNRSAWSHADHLVRDYWALGVRYVGPGGLNVRTGPSTRYQVLGQLQAGVPVAVHRTEASWSLISFAGRQAWIWSGNLKVSPLRDASSPPSRSTSRAGFIQLAASGPGFESYAAAYGRWGRPDVIYGLERAAARWAMERRDRLGIGDISLAQGGPFSPHSSHQRGTEVDVAPVRADARELPVRISDRQYSRTWTRRALELLRAEIPTRVVLFNDTAIPGVTWWPGHHDHLHLSARD